MVCNQPGPQNAQNCFENIGSWNLSNDQVGIYIVLNDCALKNFPLGDFDDRSNLGAMGLERSDRLTLCFLFLPLKGQPCHLDLSLRFLIIHTEQIIASQVSSEVTQLYGQSMDI